MIQIAMKPEQFEAKKDELLASQGIALNGDHGTIAKYGVKADYTYGNGTLSIAIRSKPFLVTTKYCEDQLLSWLASA